MQSDRKTLSIYGVSSEARLKLRLLSIAHYLPAGLYLEKLIEQAWATDMPVMPEANKRVKRAFKRWLAARASDGR